MPPKEKEGWGADVEDVDTVVILEFLPERIRGTSQSGILYVISNEWAE